MRFAVLGSGSKGNALVVQGGGATLLVDVGYGPREIKRRLESLDVELQSLDGLLITHGHGDHIKGAKALSGALTVPTYATTETKKFCARFAPLKNHVPIAANRPFTIRGLQIHPVATPHDAPGSVCFVIDDGMERLGVCTDLGSPAENVGRALGTCDAMLLEFNYDPPMLEKGPYTPALKRRVASSRGHLSNEQAAQLLKLSMHKGLTRVLLGHISEVNNTPALALAAARPVIDGADIEVAIAPQHHPTGWLRVRRSSAGVPRSVAPRPQLSTYVAPAQARRHAALERQLTLFSA